MRLRKLAMLSTRNNLVMLLIVTMITWRVQARDEQLSDTLDHDSDVEESDSGANEDQDLADESAEGRR
jgi:hypothetical protein